MSAPSRIVQGLMRVFDKNKDDLYSLIAYGLDHGITSFDTADCYGGGASESLIGEVLSDHPELREKMYLQTKCSIRRARDGKSYYDLSKEHILEAVDASLSRLKTPYVDSLLLHRPDIFLNAKGIAEAFEELYRQGKVLHFGVSNFPKETLEYLFSEVRVPIEVNQVELGLGHLPLVSEPLNTNLNHDDSIYRAGELFYYMKRKGIALQAWSPFQKGYFGGVIFDEGRFPELNQALREMTERYHVSKAAIATAFILALGEDVSVVTGSMDPAHVQECIDGASVPLSKEDWYILYRAAGANLP